MEQPTPTPASGEFSPNTLTEHIAEETEAPGTWQNGVPRKTGLTAHGSQVKLVKAGQATPWMQLLETDTREM